MKIQLILAACFITATTVAQTGLIAHKSHSGTATTFELADPGNFGGPAIEPVLQKNLKKVTWLNDTTIVFSGTYQVGYALVYQPNNSPKETEEFKPDYFDTIYNHPVLSDPNIPVDTLKKLFSNYNGPNTSIDFENFDKKEVKTPPKPTDKERKTKKSKAVTTGEKSNADKPKKKSTLFWLWIVGGGTFTGILLISRKRKPVLTQA